VQHPNEQDCEDHRKAWPERKGSLPQSKLRMSYHRPGPIVEQMLRKRGVQSEAESPMVLESQELVRS
jgi:hypothetical protein